MPRRNCHCAALLAALALTLTGCGGSDDGPRGGKHRVTATATSGGTIDPPVRDASPGQIVQFVLRPDDGFIVARVTGCGGRLTGDLRYVTAPLSASCTVTAEFAPAPANPKIEIAGAYLTQAVQTLEHTVPLVAGRDALLRILGNEPTGSTFEAPPAIVEFFVHGEHVETLTVPAPSTVPRAVDEGQLSGTWNLRVPGRLIVPGLSFRVDLADQGAYPADGGDKSAPTFDLDPFRLHFIPVAFDDVEPVSHPGNVSPLLDFMARVMPIGDYAVEWGETYTTSAVRDGVLNTSALLVELRELQEASGTGATYVGMFSRGDVGGRAFIGRPVALSTHNPRTFAHEIGHTLSLGHAPCGPGDPHNHPGYPHAGGVIGAWGWDPASDELHAPTLRDLMGNCSSGPAWISDFFFRVAAQFRHAEAVRRRADAAPHPTAAMVVWGTIGENGVQLEPAYVDAASTASFTPSGPYTLQGIDASGAVLFETAFAGAAIAHAAEESFSVRIPLHAFDPARLAAVRVHARGLVVDSPMPSHNAAIRVTDLDGRRVRVEWNAEMNPMVVVRNRETGRILSFARGGSAIVYTGGAQVETTSSGVGDHARPAVR